MEGNILIILKDGRRLETTVLEEGPAGHYLFTADNTPVYRQDIRLLCIRRGKRWTALGRN